MSRTHKELVMEKTLLFKHPFTAQEVYTVILSDGSIKKKPSFRKIVRILYESDLKREERGGTSRYSR
jgi:hypothetical protein